ncbi:ABC-type multidrug transport system permease subunit [Halopolyspora algeriensis]|uniref:Transport permease protein n=1 Tax=Halopolyspora algeriensis TaxID=1500506 RepID=A0A368VYV2_9ACTN|nr:ABC transporter permease [Halopolyspora algeriensis]RCW47177.1 ABC-type multidrug transport system permease subunit [Halopolyspora algeriensis]TQM48263.1 ABC-type multidrug transport system permease subunit [Halopolyspora algeriensis]
MSVITAGARDSGVVAWRNLLNIKRNPDWLLAGTVQPIMFVLLFAYVFGGSLGGAQYREFLIGGIFVQTVAFNSSFTVIGLANDLQKGIVDRFRALPMSRVAVLLGRTTSDLAVAVLTVAIMSVCGLLVGWRIRGSVTDALLAYAVLLLFSFAMSWVGAFIGLISRSVEVAQSAGLLWLFPVTFISSAFVSAENMPGPLRAFATWNPITVTADSLRMLFGNPVRVDRLPPDAWPAQHAVPYAVGSALLIIAVFVPLAVARYRRVASR